VGWICPCATPVSTAPCRIAASTAQGLGGLSTNSVCPSLAQLRFSCLFHLLSLSLSLSLQKGDYKRTCFINLFSALVKWVIRFSLLNDIYMASGKVKFLLCLTKYHAIKSYLVLNYAPWHEDVWGSGGIAPPILNLCTRWRRVVSFTSRLLYSRGRNPRYPLYRRLEESQIRSGRGREEKKQQLVPGIEPRSSVL